MKTDDFPIVIFWTAKNLNEAEKIAEALVKEKLAACCSIVPLVRSIYMWDEKVEKSEEAKVFIKTFFSLFDKVKKAIVSRASYEVPEILALKVEAGLKDYLDWMENLHRSQ